MSLMQMKSSPSALRNREPLAQVLKPWLSTHKKVLEIASGTGEHGAYFVESFSDIIWQPSDCTEDSLGSVRAYRKESDQTRFLAPLLIDSRHSEWNTGRWELILCCNMIHISPWESCLSLIRNSCFHLDKGGLLVLYGPFIQSEVETSESNLAFDRSLKARNPEWGIRHLDQVSEEAIQNGFELAQIYPMPSHNLTVVFRLGIKSCG